MKHSITLEGSTLSQEVGGPTKDTAGFWCQVCSKKNMHLIVSRQIVYISRGDRESFVE